MTRDEMRKIERDLSDENILLKSQNARLRSELGRLSNRLRDERHKADTLRGMFLETCKELHSITHNNKPMAQCTYELCQAAAKEMAG